MQAISVALIDTNRLFREGLKSLFTDRGFRITKETSSLNEALSMASMADPPQLILIDPEGIGAANEVVEALKATCPEARVVLFTNELDISVMAHALQAGADSFLMKDMSIDALVQSLRLVIIGEKVFPTSLAMLLINGRVSANGSVDTLNVRKGLLSQREAQILRHLILGDSNKMIANVFGITEATIKVHLKSLLRKINASNRTQAAIWGFNNGFGEGKAGYLAKA